MHGDDVPRVGRVNLDFMSQACDVRINRTRIKRGVFAPDVMQELLAGDSFVSVCDRELENFKFPGSEVERLAALLLPAGGEGPIQRRQ